MSRVTPRHATGFLSRIARFVTATFSREKARRQSVSELARMDARTLADLGLTAAANTGHTPVRHALDFGQFVREFDGLGAPLHPVMGGNTHNQVPQAFVADEISPRRLRNAAANRNAPAGGTKLATA